MAMFAPLLVSLALLAPAQEEEKPAEETAQKTADTPAAAQPDPNASPADAFKIQRGFFVEGDFGIFLTIGGRNTNNPMLPKRATSNIQPTFGIIAGYDVVDAGSFSMSAGIRLAMALNGGAGQVTDEEIAGGDVTTKSNDYSVTEMGAELGFSILLTERFALTYHIHGGISVLDPDPTKTAGEPGAGTAKFAPTFGISGIIPGIELHTLLNNFTIGLKPLGYVILADKPIFGSSLVIVSRYTF